MATHKEIVGKVRRAVADFKEPVKYEKEYYADAIDFGLQKLSFDLGEPYTDVPLVPFERVFLLVKLATIQMCFVRAGERTDASETSGTSEGTDPDFTNLTVPDLTISKADETDETDQAEKWMEIADSLQREYDGEIAHIGGGTLASEVQVGTTRKIGLKEGGYLKRTLDTGPPARVLSADVDADTVTLTWDIWYHETFKYYRVYRATDEEFSDAADLGVFSDNHSQTKVDSELAAGTYFYKVVTVNRNELTADSNIQEVTIV